MFLKRQKGEHLAGRHFHKERQAVEFERELERSSALAFRPGDNPRGGRGLASGGIDLNGLLKRGYTQCLQQAKRHD